MAQKSFEAEKVRYPEPGVIQIGKCKVLTKTFEKFLDLNEERFKQKGPITLKELWEKHGFAFGGYSTTSICYRIAMSLKVEQHQAFRDSWTSYTIL